MNLNEFWVNLNEIQISYEWVMNELVHELKMNYEISINELEMNFEQIVNKLRKNCESD